MASCVCAFTNAFCSVSQARDSPSITVEHVPTASWAGTEDGSAMSDRRGGELRVGAGELNDSDIRVVCEAAQRFGWA